MKRILKKAAMGLTALVLAACVSTTAPEEKNVITVGATAVPHAQILEEAVKPLLEKEGWELEVTVFNDYVQPNTSVEDGTLDANYYQTIRYMNEENKNRGLHLRAVAGVHLEPMGLYSAKIKQLSELSDGAEIAIPNDSSNESRALKLLEDSGLLRLNDDVTLYTPHDIVENPHSFQFTEIESPSLTRTLEDVDAAVINGNYALQAGLSPLTDALVSETADGSQAPYHINYIVVKDGNQNTEKIEALCRAIHSEEVRDYIAKTYSGSVIPAFTDGNGNPLQ